jgi:glycosyltransferase involved in cell wall biosynthesis
MERAVAEQVEHLQAQGVAVTVVTQPPTGLTPSPTHPVNRPGAENRATTPAIDWRFVTYGHWPLRRNSVLDRLINYPRFVQDVRAHLAAHRLPATGLVHAHGLLVDAAPASCPLVYAPHGLEEFSRADWRKWLAYAPLRRQLRRAAQRAAVVIATDVSMRPAVIGALGVADARVVVVPNGVSVARLDALAANSMARGNSRDRTAVYGDPLFITCARLEKNKGLDVLVRALADVHPSLPSTWRWLIVGDGSQARHLQQSIVAFGLSPHITLLGQLPDDALHELLPQMDVFLLPSRYEGSSIATLEAMTHRLPVLATRVGGLPDKVVEGQTGWLVEPDDASALAGGLRRALASRARWTAMGERGRQLVLQRFNWPVLATQMISIYRQLSPSSNP